MNGYTLGRQQEQAKWLTGAPVQLPLEFCIFAKRLFYVKKHVINQAIAVLRQSLGLLGRLVTVWKIEPDTHTHRRCSLWVATLRHSSHPCDCSEKSDVELQPGLKVTDFTAVKRVFQEGDLCSLSQAKKAKMESLGAGESSARRRMPFVDALKEQDAWILDIDLDFFATNNPFKGNFTEVS